MTIRSERRRAASSKTTDLGSPRRTSGFQRLSSGLFIFTQDTLEPVGYQPNFGGHHDCVIVPSKVEHLKNSRCTTL